MKRKKTAHAVEIEKPTQVVPAAVSPQLEMSMMDVMWICLFSVLMFLSMTLQTGRMTMVLMVMAFALSIGKAPVRHLKERLCVPVLGFLLFMLINGLASIYSDFGEYAVKEVYKILASAALALIVLLRFEKRHFRGLLWGFAVVCTAIAMLCLDAGGSEVLFGAFVSFMRVLGGDYSGVHAGLTNSNQLGGIYNDANITGSLLGIALLVFLYLIHNSERKTAQAAGSVLLGISALTFFLSMSRGAILCFGIALLVFLILDSQRIRLFFLVFLSAAVTVATAVIAMPLLGTGSALPDVLAFAAGGVIALLDLLVVVPLAKKLERHQKAFGISLAVVVALAAAYLAVGMAITGPIEIGSSYRLNREVSLAPGEYSVQADSDVPLTVSVSAFSTKGALMETAESLYDGPLEEAVFSVPEDTVRVRFMFWGQPGSTLYKVTLSDGTSVKLNYPLLPSFLVERMQGGLLQTSSFLLRVQYVKDGWKLFLKSPVIGHGLGSTEGLLTSVQPFFYESLYVHNHLMQIMDEMGLVGLLSFLMVMVGVAVLLIRRLRKGRDSGAAMLLACLVMMNLHGAMEISFSIRAFQCAAYVLVMLAVLYAAEPVDQREKLVKWGAWAAIVFIWIFILLFGGLLEAHRIVDRKASSFSTTDSREFLNTIRDYARWDILDNEYYKLTFVGNTSTLNNSNYNRHLRIFAEDLRDSGTYTACSGLARYYYLPRGEFEELFACSREGIAQEASTKEAWNLQLDFYRQEVLPAAGPDNMEVYLEGVLALKDYLTEYSEGRYEEITLSEENQAFLKAVDSAKEAGMPAEFSYIYLMDQAGMENTAEEAS